MADQEIAKHAKNVIQLVTHKEHNWRHKLREMALEIFIIVFAVSLSIWLHGWGEHMHEQKQVKTFLLGLKEDIRKDLALLERVSATDRTFDQNFAYLAALDAALPPEAQKFDAAYAMLNSNFFFTPQSSRFEGFKSSGKLTNIEDATLLDNILTLYQSLHPEIKNSEHGWITQQNQLLTYLEQGLDDDSLAQRYKLIVAPKGKRLLRQAVTVPQLYERYQAYAKKGAEIIAAIDRAYP